MIIQNLLQEKLIVINIKYYFIKTAWLLNRVISHYKILFVWINIYIL